MRVKVKELTFLYLLLLLLLAVSSAFSGFLRIIIYILAYILPIVAGVYIALSRKNDEKISPLAYLKAGKREAKLVAQLSPLALLLILTVSLLTSLFLTYVTGAEDSTVIAEEPLSALLVHALLPALLEEGAFRLLPLALLGRGSPRAVVFLSAFFFALIHTSLFSIPYAFLAGVIFMAADIAACSVVPSFVMHFINNVLALLSLGAFGFTVSLPIIFGVLGGLSLLSLPLLFLRRRELSELFRNAFARGEGIELTLSPLAFAVPTLFIAIMGVLI